MRAALALLAVSCSSAGTATRTHRASPPLEPPPPAVVKPASRAYVVQPGENLYRIALRFGIAVDELAKANALDDPTKLKEGQTIVIPSSARVAPPPIVETPIKDPLEHPSPPPIGPCGDAPRSREKPSKSGWIWPVDGVVVERNDGLDIAAPHGAPIWASRDGRVLFAGEREGYGRLVIVQHEGVRVSIYAHNARNCVAEGTRVEAGDVVGLVGNSGGSASPKVHFEVREGEKAVNPRVLLP